MVSHKNDNLHGDDEIDDKVKICGNLDEGMICCAKLDIHDALYIIKWNVSLRFLHHNNRWRIEPFLSGVQIKRNTLIECCLDNFYC
jgi:hypothetical protein